MAIRVHVIGVRELPIEAVRDALAPCGVDALRRDGGWVWAREAVTSLDIAAVDDALEAMAGPTLRATTVDGSFWQLRLSGGGREPFFAEHHFSLLDPDRLKQEKADCDDLREFAGRFGLPSEPIGDRGLDTLTLGSMRKLLALEARRIADGLEAFHIPVDGRALQGTLKGKRVHPIELGWDVGNLPRFLSSLALDQALPDFELWIEEEEASARSQQDRMVQEHLQPLSWIREALEDFRAEPIDGEPVPLPLEHLTSLLYIGTHYASVFGIGFSFDLENNEPVFDRLARAELVTPAVVGRRVDASINAWPRPSQTIRQVSACLLDLESGARFEFLIAPPPSQETPVNHRFEGTIEGNSFLIDSVYPPMARERLESILELMDQYRKGKTVEVASEEEREAVLAEAAEAIWFFHGPPKITATGLRLEVEPQSDVDGVIEFLFLRRYGDVFDVTRRAEWHRTNALSARIAAADAPSDSLASGEACRIEPMEVTGNLSAEFTARLAEAEEAGFTFLGWIRVLMSASEFFVASFRNDAGDMSLDINGQLQQGSVVVAGVDLTSRLSTGVWITTTSTIFATSQPDKGIFKFPTPGADIARLQIFHANHIENRDGDPETRFASLEAVIESMEEFFELEGLAAILG